MSRFRRPNLNSSRALEAVFWRDDFRTLLDDELFDEFASVTDRSHISIEHEMELNQAMDILENYEERIERFLRLLTSAPNYDLVWLNLGLAIEKLLVDTTDVLNSSIGNLNWSNILFCYELAARFRNQHAKYYSERLKRRRGSHIEPRAPKQGLWSDIIQLLSKNHNSEIQDLLVFESRECQGFEVIL